MENLLGHRKDKKSIGQTSEVVYVITCKGYDKSYIGETGRQFGVRLKEHHKDTLTGNSPVQIARNHLPQIGAHYHVAQENHVIDWEAKNHRQRL